jgi:hypothetical protein
MRWHPRSEQKTARAWGIKQRFKDIHILCRAGAAPEPLYRTCISWAKRNGRDSNSVNLPTLPSSVVPAFIDWFRAENSVRHLSERCN